MVARRDRGLRKKTTLLEYLAYMRSAAAEDPFYLSDWRLSQACPELADAYAVPPCFSSWLEHLSASVRPEFRWIYLGPAGSGTRLHTDVWDTAAWNALLSGRKAWTFFCRDTSGTTVFRCVQRAGDIIFTPSGCPHAVSNLSRTLALTENFVNELNYKNVLTFLRRHRRAAWVGRLQSLEAHYRAGTFRAAPAVTAQPTRSLRMAKG
jgi:histone arginine demethylase JMJD6